MATFRLLFGYTSVFDGFTSVIVRLCFGFQRLFNGYISVIVRLYLGYNQVTTRLCLG